MHVIIAPKLSIRIKLMTTRTLLAMFVTIMMTLTEMVSLMSMTIVYLIPMLISWIQVHTYNHFLESNAIVKKKKEEIQFHYHFLNKGPSINNVGIFLGEGVQ
jgi:hypothetical protein